MSLEQYLPGPDLSELCEKLKKLNPEFAAPVSPRAGAYLEQNLPLEKLRTKTAIESRMQAFRMRLLAVIEQGN
jgi:hypothetical protein